MVFIAGIIPTTLGGIIGLLINALLTTLAIIIADKIIANEIDLKHSFIMGLAAYFVTPIIVSFLGLVAFTGDIVSTYVIPLVVWIVLGQILLQTQRRTKLIVSVLGFGVYLVLVYVGLPSAIAGIIPF